MRPPEYLQVEKRFRQDLIKILNMCLFKFFSESDKQNVIPKQLIKATSKSKEDKNVENHPLENVNNHFAQRDLERSKVWIDTKDVNQLQVR